MSRRGWAIIGAVIGVGVVVGLLVWLFASTQGDPAASPAPSAPPASSVPADTSPAPTPPTASPSPTPSMVTATCETTSTAEFRALAAQNGWVSWETQDQTIGARPFDRFPGGAPVGQLLCRWGESPDIPTDNLIDLAWSPIASSAAAAQESLIGEGYERIDAPEGMYLAMPSADGWADDEGYGDSYLFTDDDVRWAMTKADLASVKAPDEPE